MRHLPFASAVTALVIALAGCSSESDQGCTKDTDCASGRICGSAERCVDREANASSSSSAAAPADEGRDCHAYLIAFVDCSVEACDCGATCVTVNYDDDKHRCANSCAVDDDCIRAARAAGIEPEPGAVTCFPASEINGSFCVWHY